MRKTATEIALEKQIAKLQKQLESYEEQLKIAKNNSSFSKMSYSELMDFYIENQFSDLFDRDNPTTVAEEWRSAYAVFKQKRVARDLQIASLVRDYLNRHNGTIILKDEIEDELSSQIIALYKTETPFDCEDDKWKWSYSWNKRIKLSLTRYFDGQPINVTRRRIVVDMR